MNVLVLKVSTYRSVASAISTNKSGILRRFKLAIFKAVKVKNAGFVLGYPVLRFGEFYRHDPKNWDLFVAPQSDPIIVRSHPKF